MNNKRMLAAMGMLLMITLPVTESWGRGRGGGGGGGGRSMGGGGSNFGGGGRSMGGGGFSGGGGANLGGGSGGRSMGGGGFGGSAGGFGGSSGRSGGATGMQRSNSGATSGSRNLTSGSRGTTGRTASPAGGGGISQRNPSASGNAGNRFSSPSQSQLGGFLGLPSDGGLGGLNPSDRSRDDNFDVNKSTAEGPRGGNVAGATVTGPKGNSAGKAIGVGPNGTVGKVGGVRGADGGASARGAAVGPDGRVAAGSAVRGPNGGAAARGAVRGPEGAAAGFAGVSPSGRYTSATAIRRDYNHGNIYGGAWYTNNPGAWYAAGWATGAAWRTATWNSLGAWMPGYATTPVYYDYGNNITYEDSHIYVAGQDVGTIAEYSQQATELAETGAAADAPADGDWLPLGVFALTKPGQTDSVVSIQLAVNKEGIIRGNYTDTKTEKTRPIQGAVNKETQRVAFTVGDNKANLIETGLYNLTKDEAPALVHLGDDKTEQWLLVRLTQDNSAES